MKLNYTTPSKIIVAALILLMTSVSYAQIGKKETRFLDKVRFGGGFGVNFSNNNFNINVSPSAIYDFNQYVSAGPSLIYSYQSNDFFKSSLYGASIIGLFNPLPQVQISTELEQLRVNQTLENNAGDIDRNFWNTAFFVGGGYRTQNITIGIRYNVLFDDDDGIYNDAWAPFVRVFF